MLRFYFLDTCEILLIFVLSSVAPEKRDLSWHEGWLLLSTRPGEAKAQRRNVLFRDSCLISVGGSSVDTMQLGQECVATLIAGERCQIARIGSTWAIESQTAQEMGHWLAIFRHSGVRVALSPKFPLRTCCWKQEYITQQLRAL